MSYELIFPNPKSTVQRAGGIGYLFARFLCVGLQITVLVHE